MPSTHVETALSMLKTFANFDIDASVALRTSTCKHTMAPASLGFPVMDNDMFRKHIAGLSRTVIGIPVTPVRIFDGGKVVTIHATSEIVFRPEATDSEVDWSYHGEYVFVFEMNEAGDRVESIVEFLDSAAVQKALLLLERGATNLTSEKDAT